MIFSPPHIGTLTSPNTLISVSVVWVSWLEISISITNSNMINKRNTFSFWISSRSRNNDARFHWDHATIVHVFLYKLQLVFLEWIKNMTTSYLITIPKTEIQLKNVQGKTLINERTIELVNAWLDFTRGIFVDNSGSTGSSLPLAGKSILAAELAICQVTQFQSIALWNSQAKLCTDLRAARPEGGTDPASIFQNSTTKKAFEDSDIVVFVTDGDIDAGSVTRVRTSCVSQWNWSEVFQYASPYEGSFEQGIDHLSHRPSEKTRSISDQHLRGGTIADGFECSLSLSQWSNILHSLFERSDHSILSLTNQPWPITTHFPPPISPNYSRTSKSPHPRRFLVVMCGFVTMPIRWLPSIISSFFRWKTFNPCRSWTDEDWKNVDSTWEDQQHSAGAPSIGHSDENRVDSWRETSLSKRSFHFEFSLRRDALISRIVHLKLTEDEHSKDLEDLRRQLAEISRQAAEEEQIYLRLINNNLRESRQHWNEVLHWIHKQEQGLVFDQRFSTSLQIEPAERKCWPMTMTMLNWWDILDHTDVPSMECAICMDGRTFSSLDENHRRISMIRPMIFCLTSRWKETTAFDRVSSPIRSVGSVPRPMSPRVSTPRVNC